MVNNTRQYLWLLLLACALFGCNQNSPKDNYKTIYDQLATKTGLIELVADGGKARLIVSPEHQGRIVTSTYGGRDGEPNGWVNKKLLATGAGVEGSLGGEDRVWIGPLGSQFSFYYQQIKPLSEDNWLVPKPMEAEPYALISQSDKEANMQKRMRLANFIGTEFDILVKRSIRILGSDQAERLLSISLPENMPVVGFESYHELVNKSERKMDKGTGLVAVWSAGMFEGSDGSTVIIPATKPLTTDSLLRYMGPLHEDRLKMVGQTILFKADGKYRTKIGVPRHMAPPIYGCYAKDKNRLTIIAYKQTNDSLYFNSDATVQQAPYKGEVIPIYNNGRMDYAPTDEASFYELESTSAMLALAPNEALVHYHRVFHFGGNIDALNKISVQLLGVDLNMVANSF